MEQVLYKLTDGWEWRSVKELSHNIQYGHTAKAESNGNAKFLRITDIQDGKIDWQGVPTVSLEEKEISKYALNDDDLIFARSGATAGKSILIKNAPKDAVFASYLIRIVPNKKDIIPEYLSYFFLTPAYWEVVGQNAAGAAQPNINGTKLSEFIVPVAPQGEQKRIVEKLDGLLTRIDTAIEHLQSKLDLSKQLFDSVLDQFFRLTDCDSVPLTEVVDFIGGSQPPKSQFSDTQKEGYVRLIQIRDYKTDSHIVYVDSASTKKFCTKDDVMIGRYGPPVFQILRGLDGAYNVALMKAVPNEDVLTKDYLFWFLQSPSIQNYVIGISQRAAGQSGVNKKALEKYLIPVPNKTMQNDIVDKVGQLVDKSRYLEAEVRAEMTSLNQLKASILDSAFKGEL